MRMTSLTSQIRRASVRAVIVVLTLVALLVPATVAASSGIGGASAPSPRHQPDARIRLDCAFTTEWQPCEGDWVGDDIYNRTAVSQKSRWTDYLTYSPERDPPVIVFRISIENDGTVADRFRVLAAGETNGYRVKFFKGTTNITASVESGSFQTPLLSPGDSFVVKAKVVMPCDSWDECGQDKALRLVTIRSLADPTRRDAVKFVRRVWECTC